MPQKTFIKYDFAIRDAIEFEAKDAHTALMDANEYLRASRDTLRRIEVQNAKDTDRFNRPSVANVASAKKAKHELERHSKRVEVLESEYNRTNPIANRIKESLEDLRRQYPNAIYEDTPLVIDSSKKGKKNELNFHTEIEKCRTTREELINEREWLRGAPLPVDEVIENIQTGLSNTNYEIERLLGQFIFPGRNAHDHQLFIINGQLRNAETLDSGGVVGRAEIDLAPVLNYFLGDMIKNKLIDHVNGLSYEPGPITAERAELIADLDSQIKNLEVDEELLIRQALDAGFKVYRRADTDPYIMLNIVVEQREVPEPEAKDAPKPKRNEKAATTAFDEFGKQRNKNIVSE